MAVTPFVGITWQPLDLIDDWKMDSLVNNIQYVHDNTPRAKYGSRSQGVKIASGRVTIPRNPKKDTDSVTVSFSGFFSPGCQPYISLGIMSPVQTNIYATFRGLSRLEPDHNGMRVDVQVGEKAGDKDKIKRTFAVHWLAMGY